MRTLRKVLCILCLAVLVTSSAAWAVPTERAEDGRSITSWALSVVESLVSAVTFGEIDGDISGDEPQSLEDGDEPPDDEFGGSLDPHG